jgi:hypothetical protein
MNSNTQTNQQQAGNEEIIINKDDVNYAIKKLSLYDDCYSKGIVAVFNSYLENKDFRRMRDELETVPRVEMASYNLWDFNTHAGFLEVIYPV